MIDLTEEQVVTLSAATKFLPMRRGGKKAHPSTLFRWASHGCRGVRLEIVQVGGSKCTSREAIQRFCDRLTHGGSAPSSATPRQRQRRIEQANAELAKAGI